MDTRKIALSLLFTAVAATAFSTVKPRYRGAGRHAVHTESETENVYAGGPRRIGTHASAALTSIGSPKVPVILVQFPDKHFSVGLENGDSCTDETKQQLVREFYNKYCNGDGVNEYWKDAGSFGSIREYFRDQSNGQFTPQFEVMGPVILDHTYAYYGANTANQKDVRISNFYADAMKKAIKSTEGWNEFDNNKDGVVDMAFFIYAGPGESSFDPQLHPEAANLIWPKESPSGGTISNVRIGSYACCNETYNDVADGIGVFVHELSHAMGLPDFYDTRYVAYGLDFWDIMDSGCYCNSGYTPCNYSAYERDFMGWKSLITLDGVTPQHIRIEPISSFGDAYKIVNPNNANEYLVIENRQNQVWDSFVGHSGVNTKFHGLLVTHVDFSLNRWTSNTVNTNPAHQYISIVPADGKLDSYMYVETVDDYNDFMYSAWGDPFPGFMQVKSLDNPGNVEMYQTSSRTVGEEVVKDTTTYSLPLEYTGKFDISPFNQPIRNIVENADGSIEFDYCPKGITPEDLAITGVQLDQPRNASFIYNLQGQCVAKSNSEIHQLPAGIYISGGKKIRIK